MLLLAVLNAIYLLIAAWEAAVSNATSAQHSLLLAFNQYLYFAVI